MLKGHILRKSCNYGTTKLKERKGKVEASKTRRVRSNQSSTVKKLVPTTTYIPVTDFRSESHSQILRLLIQTNKHT